VYLIEPRRLLWLVASSPILAVGLHERRPGRGMDDGLLEAVMEGRPEILVVCTKNAGRSVAARVLLDHHGAGRVVVRSAGSRPGDALNPSVARVLTDRGLDVSGEFPKALEDHAVRDADMIITMDCGDACPVYPGKRYLDWDVADPAGRPLDEVRAIVDDIERRVLALLDELGIRSAPTS
jgi:arsenate reductase (thioredoxin)